MLHRAVNKVLTTVFYCNIVARLDKDINTYCYVLF